MPCSGAPFAELGHLAGIGLHLVAGQHRLGGERLGTVALDRAADFAIDDARRIDRLEQVDHRQDAVLVGSDRPSLTSVPENQPPQSVTSAALQDRQHQCIRIFREAAAFFHAGEAGRARLAQAFFQRHVIAEFRKIVIPPGDGRHAEFGFHRVQEDREHSEKIDISLSVADALVFQRLFVGLRTGFVDRTCGLKLPARPHPTNCRLPLW